MQLNKQKKLTQMLLAITLTVLLPLATSAQQTSKSSGDDRTQREIWLAPAQHSAANVGSVDFMDMFTPDAPWKKAASHTKVFKLYSGFVVTATQGKIDTIVADLNRRGIAIALETGVMNVPPNPPSGCGGLGNVEGYGITARAAKISQIIKKAHGEIKYIAMDEPFFYGHYYTHVPGKGVGCQSPVQQVIQLTKPTLDVFIREFPNVVIGDIEPTNFVGNQPDWQNDLSGWVKGFRDAMGRPLAFFDLDVVWFRPNSMQEAATLFHECEQFKQQHLIDKIGIIYNGLRQDQSDEKWIKDAQQHILTLEGTYKLHPEQVIFQSWDPNPTHSLPETGPYTLTSLVNFFLATNDHEK
jgi:hypothetical protein